MVQWWRRIGTVAAMATPAQDDRFQRARRWLDRQPARPASWIAGAIGMVAMVAIASGFEPVGALAGGVVLLAAAVALGYVGRPVYVVVHEEVDILMSQVVDLVRIEGGTLRMGSPESDPQASAGERPPHEVAVPTFCMSRTPVTREQYRSVMTERAARSGTPDGDDDRLPQSHVSWFDAVVFCNALSSLESRAPFYAIDGRTVRPNPDADGYRLPSEAEWEYAARAGTTTRYFFGDDDAKLERHAWFAQNSGHRVQPVAEKEPNPWGLHDMVGNVWEWCEDTWHESYEGAPSDGSAWVDASSSARVLRGGSAWNPSRSLRCAYRVGDVPEVSRENDGFRVVRSPRRQP